MRKLSEKELANVKGGFIDIVPSQNLFAMRNIKTNFAKHTVFFNWKKFLGLS